MSLLKNSHRKQLSAVFFCFSVIISMCLSVLVFFPHSHHYVAKSILNLKRTPQAQGAIAPSLTPYEEILGSAPQGVAMAFDQLFTRYEQWWQQQKMQMQNGDALTLTTPIDDVVRQNAQHTFDDYMMEVFLLKLQTHQALIQKTFTAINQREDAMARADMFAQNQHLLSAGQQILLGFKTYVISHIEKLSSPEPMLAKPLAFIPLWTQIRRGYQQWNYATHDFLIKPHGPDGAVLSVDLLWMWLRKDRRLEGLLGVILAGFLVVYLQQISTQMRMLKRARQRNSNVEVVKKASALDQTKGPLVNQEMSKYFEHVLGVSSTPPRGSQPHNRLNDTLKKEV